MKMMKCEVVQDLLALYADDCCSEESKRVVEEHLRSCPECRKVLEEMKAPVIRQTETAPLPALKRVDQWKASVIQSVTMFLSFIALVAGVSLEAYTPSGATNGAWALSVIIPVTALLLSQVNWYFVRLYKSRSIFSACSMLLTLLLSLCGYVWAWLHYRLGAAFSAGSSPLLLHFGAGIALTLVFCALSKLLSGNYAKQLGKE